jgi:hypothetical protein
VFSWRVFTTRSKRQEQSEPRWRIREKSWGNNPKKSCKNYMVNNWQWRTLDILAGEKPQPDNHAPPKRPG